MKKDNHLTIKPTFLVTYLARSRLGRRHGRSLRLVVSSVRRSGYRADGITLSGCASEYPGIPGL